MGVLPCRSGSFLKELILTQLQSIRYFPFRAQAGFNKGRDMNYFALPGSGTSGVLSLSNTSFINMTGVWIFRVDQDEIVVGGTYVYNSIS